MDASAATPFGGPCEALYTSDRYLALTGGDWHLTDSPFKSRYAQHLIARNGLRPQRVCEIGCGAGGVMADLQRAWPTDTSFVGFDISPAALDLASQFANDRLQFRLADAPRPDENFDLVLVLDVVEHVEDCFGFLRKARACGRHQIYHIPLEITCTNALRDILGSGFALGHVHHFCRASALAALRHTGHTIVDWMYTPVGFECGRRLQTRLLNVARRMVPTELATRLFGGFSLMVLTR